MSRHLLIALAVLVPFAGLVAFGFSLLKDPPPLTFPAPEVRYVPPPPAPVPLRVEPVRILPPPLPTAVQVVAPTPPPPPPPVVAAIKPPPELSADAKRLPIIAAVEPMVMQCFKDVSEQVREPMRVTVAFNTTLEGGFEAVVLKKTTWQDPNLIACIIDSFADAHFEPTGFALKRQHYTFAFPPPDAGF